MSKNKWPAGVFGELNKKTNKTKIGYPIFESPEEKQRRVEHKMDSIRDKIQSLENQLDILRTSYRHQQMSQLDSMDVDSITRMDDESGI